MRGVAAAVKAVGNVALRRGQGRGRSALHVMCAAAITAFLRSTRQALREPRRGHPGGALWLVGLGRSRSSLLQLTLSIVSSLLQSNELHTPILPLA